MRERAPTPGHPPLGSTFHEEQEEEQQEQEQQEEQEEQEGGGARLRGGSRGGLEAHSPPRGQEGLHVEERDELDYGSRPGNGGESPLPVAGAAKLTSRRSGRPGSRHDPPLPSVRTRRSRPATQRSVGKPFPVESSYEGPDNAAHARDLLAQVRGGRPVSRARSCARLRSGSLAACSDAAERPAARRGGERGGGGGRGQGRSRVCCAACGPRAL